MNTLKLDNPVSETVTPNNPNFLKVSIYHHHVQLFFWYSATCLSIIFKKCLCDKIVEPNGRHGLSCRNQAGRWSRHNEVNHLIKRALVQAKIPATLEPSNLSSMDGKRPDGLTFLSWKQSKPMIWDFTCCDTVCDTYVKSSAKKADFAAELREDQKSKHYQDLNNFYFVPIAAETFGAWGPRGQKIMKEIGKKVHEATGEKRSTFYLFQSISTAIQRGNAACVIGTAPTSEGL